jgi:outer membrane murein-binding lipoprotein Lpp
MKYIKYAPWGLSVVLAALLLFVFLSKSSEINKLDQQISTLNQQSATLRQQNTALTEKYNTFVENTNQINADLTKKLNDANMPEATVSIGFRHGAAVITNISDVNISVGVEIKRPSSVQSKNYDLVILARSAKQIGSKEGWAFASGDVVTVSQPNHKPRTNTLQ